MMYKIAFEQEIHICKAQQDKFSDLLEFIKKSFKQLPETFSLFYLDQEGDLITLSCQEDLVALNRSGIQKVKIQIQATGSNFALFDNDALAQSLISQSQENFTLLKQPEDSSISLSALLEQKVSLPGVNIALPSMKECKYCTFLNELTAKTCCICENKLEEVVIPVVVPIVEEKSQQPILQQQPIIQQQQPIIQQEQRLLLQRKLSAELLVQEALEQKEAPKIKDPTKVGIKKMVKRMVKKEVARQLQQQQQQSQQQPNPSQEKCLFNLVDQSEKLIKQAEDQNKSHLQEVVEKIVSPLTGLKNSLLQNSRNVVIHLGYTCDGCDMRGIQGPRYKCAVCIDFDFCEKCEQTIPHNHPFLKIRTPEQAPISIQVTIQDEKFPVLDQKKQQSSQPSLFGCDFRRKEPVSYLEKQDWFQEQIQQQKQKEEEEIATEKSQKLLELQQRKQIEKELTKKQKELAKKATSSISWTAKNLAKEFAVVLGGVEEDYYSDCENNKNLPRDQIVSKILLKRSAVVVEEQKPVVVEQKPVVVEEQKPVVVEEMLAQMIQNQPVQEEPKKKTKIYEQGAIVKAGRVAEILSGKPEDYYDICQELNQYTSAAIIDMILIEKQFYSKNTTTQ